MGGRESRLTMKSRQASGPTERFGRGLDCQPVNVEALVVEDPFGHRSRFSMTSTSTAASG